MSYSMFVLVVFYRRLGRIFLLVSYLPLAEKPAHAFDVAVDASAPNRVTILIERDGGVCTKR